MEAPAPLEPCCLCLPQAGGRLLVHLLRVVSSAERATNDGRRLRRVSAARDEARLEPEGAHDEPAA